jgi:putative toxin-antitoxin system antitoxin component (TIGR02293 family)
VTEQLLRSFPGEDVGKGLCFPISRGLTIDIMHETIVLPMGNVLAKILGVPGGEGSLMEATRKGLPAISASRLAEVGGLTSQQLAAALGVSKRTLARKKGKSRLNAVESDRAVRLARVLTIALEVFSNRKNATIEWLHDPIVALGGKAPVEFLDTDEGLRRVEQVLVQLDYGGVT